MRQTRCLVQILLLAESARGFVVLVDSRVDSRRPAVTTLGAKKAAKAKKRKQDVRSGGFGSEATKVDKFQDDYGVFPRLEPNVIDTLVPMRQDTTNKLEGPLKQEVVQRLDQIYGFPKFNKEPETAETESLSLSDMLSAESDTTSSLDNLLNPTPSVSLGNSNLDDLLASATGGSTTSRGKIATEEKPDLSLDCLPSFENIRVLHVDPMVVAIDNFFTEEECDRYIAMSSAKEKNVMQSRSPTVGKDAASKAQRTSTTWYHQYKNVPELMAKATRLLGLDTINRWEEPQTVRYRKSEKFTWHLDALGPAENQERLGGQRIATLLVYLTGLSEEQGGATLFRDLGEGDSALRVRPQKGSALLFFPAAGGIPSTPVDFRTLHSGEAVAADSEQDKWISQLWLRVRPYQAKAPPGNDAAAATEAIVEYCKSFA